MNLRKNLILVLTVLLIATSFTATAQNQGCTGSNSTQNCFSPPSIDVDRQTGMIITAGLLFFTASFYYHHLKEKEKRK